MQDKKCGLEHWRLRYWRAVFAAAGLLVDARTASLGCELVEPEPWVYIGELAFGVGASGSDP